MREREKNECVKCAALNDLILGRGEVTPEIEGFDLMGTYSTDSLDSKK